MSLLKYNPAQMSPAERARRFAGREADLEPLLDILRDNIARASNQHVLVTGPRGIGKTTLLLRTIDIVRDDPTFSRQWFPIVAAEETYRVSSIGEFWLEMLFHLSRTTGDSQQNQAYESLRTESNDRRLAESARGALLDFADTIERRLILVVENLQMLFDGQMNDADSWALRETLIGDPRIMLLASAVSTFDQIENPNAAMFELFLVRPLAPLNTKGCQHLWQTLTGQSITRKRVRPLEILTGGNPRLLVILSEFAANKPFGQLMEDLVSLIDDHTDYLKSTTEALPALERKVFVSLAELWRDSTAAEVAAEARLDVNTASAQLIRLEGRGAVTAQRRGRAKLYRLAERLYNIYHLMRRHGGQEARVRAAVEFMAVYYGADSLPDRLQSIAQEVLALPPGSRGEHFMAIEKLLSRSEFQESRARIVSVLRPSISGCDDVPESLLRLLSTEKPGDIKETAAISDVDLLKTPVQNLTNPYLLARRAYLQRQDNPNESIACLRKALSIDPLLVPLWALLAAILDELGNYKESLEANQNAVEQYRRLAKARPDAFLPHLAGSLNNLGVSLSDLGRKEEALAATREAVETYRQLAKTRPDAFLTDLAGSLNNLGVSLSDLGRKEEALEAAQEAVVTYRQLAKDRPDAFLSDLAGSLNNLGNHLGDLGRKEEALEVAQEAVTTYRQLAKASPDAFLPDFAMSLNNLGNHLGDLGRKEEAFAVVQEAVASYRRLAKARPEAFLADLAMSLNNLGGCLRELGRMEEALAAAQEAVVTYRRLAKVRPAVFRPLLAKSLSNMGGALLNLNREDEARNALNEALAVGPEYWPDITRLIELFIDRGETEETLRVLQSILAGKSSFDPMELHNAISIAVEIAAAGKGARLLEIIQSSPAAGKLEPLIVGLQKHLGLETLAPPEIEEVAKDIARDISERAAKKQS